MKRFRAEDVEEVVLGYLESVLQKEGYFDGIEKTLAAQQGNTVNMLEVKKRKLEQRIVKAEKDIKALIRVQLNADSDAMLRDLYGSELKELKAAKDADVKLLSQIGSQLLDTPSAKAQRETIHSHVKELRAAWEKASASLKKRLLRTVFQRLVFRHDSIDIFYRTDAKVVEGKKKPPLDGCAHKAKVQGWYISTNGSGGWI